MSRECIQMNGSYSPNVGRLEKYKQRHLRCFAYCRVSTDDQDQRNSLVAQKDFFEKFCSQSFPNWERPIVFADEGISGTSLEKRDAFCEMLIRAKRGEAKIILVKDVYRFARNCHDALKEIIALKKKKVYVYFYVNNIFTADDNYRARLDPLLTNAEAESFATSDRVIFGQALQMQKGIVFGRRRMYGYTITRDNPANPDEQVFHIIEEEAEVIRQIFEWFVAGDGSTAIANRLMKKGVPSTYEKGWSATVILRILRNEKYVGDLLQGKTYTPDMLDHKKKYNKDERPKYFIKDHHPEAAIISREIWDKAQAIFEANAISDSARVKYARRYYLSGRVRCGICGAPYISHIQRGIHCFSCVNNTMHGTRKEIITESGETITIGCSAKRLNYKAAGMVLTDILSTFLSQERDEVLAASLQGLRDKYDSKLQDNNIEQKLKNIDEEIEKRRQTLKRMFRNLSEGLTDVETYRRATEEVNGEITALNEKRDKLFQSFQSYNDYQMNIDYYTEKIKKFLNMKEEDINSEYFERVLKKIIVYPNYVLEIYFNFLPQPVFVRYKTFGRGKNYRVETTYLKETDEERQKIEAQKALQS